MKELLNIVDDHDQVIGEKSREEIHRDGLLHREIHVYFVTPDQKIIFQHRAKDKDTYPDLLDATVGGHVEIGHSYAATAVKETEEETGVRVNESDLIFIDKVRKKSVDRATGKINNVFSSCYVYFYPGSINDLRIEAVKALGFEAHSLGELMNLSVADQARFISSILKFAVTELAEFIKKYPDKII
ncbi:MAG: NUDIX domain-containing protein [Patescibacteria group bacterium]|jgi:isopentenyldiphosphate isomerase